jgi:hypothetical protein
VLHRAECGECYREHTIQDERTTFSGMDEKVYIYKFVFSISGSERNGVVRCGLDLSGSGQVVGGCDTVMDLSV